MRRFNSILAVTSVTAFVCGLASISNALQADSGISLEQRVKHLEELNQTRNKLQADMSYQLSELQREVRQLTGQIEEHEFKIKQIQDRQRELYRDIERRLSGVSSKGANTTAQKETTSQTRTAQTAGASQVNQANPEARRGFESAFALVREKKYEQALSAFDKFLIQYPSTEYSANALYWMGQVHLVKGNADEAEKQFLRLKQAFPASTKYAQATLKLGDIYLKRKDWTKAKANYNEAANSQNASHQQLARKGLEAIKKAGH